MDDSKHGVGIGSDFSASAPLRIAEEEGTFIFLITFFLSWDSNPALFKKILLLLSVPVYVFYLTTLESPCEW